MLSKSITSFVGLFILAITLEVAAQQSTPGSNGWRHWGSPGADSVPRPPVQAEYLRVQVRVSDVTIFVENDFRITSGDGWTFIPVTFVYLEKGNVDKPLHEKADEDFRVEWSVVIPPEEYTATWRETTVKFTKADLEAATDLPKGKRTVLWAVPALWHIEAKTYLPFGWEAAAPLAVTTDAAGKITAMETFPTSPRQVERNHRTQTLVGKECKLDLKQLQLKDDCRLVKNAYGLQIVGPTSQIGLDKPGRGAFFGAIDTPEKARELFEVGIGGSKIIKDKEQYELIRTLGTQLGDREFYRTGAEVTSGIKLTEVPGIGYHIEALTLDYSLESEKFIGVSQRDTYITNEGVITEKGWRGNYLPPEFDKMVRPFLKEASLETVPVRVTVTNKDVTTPEILNNPPPANVKP